MSDYVKTIKTSSGDRQIDYEALANTPSVNNKELKGNVNLTAEDVGADALGSAENALSEAKLYTSDVASSKVDKTTTINGKPLSGNVTLSSADIGAMPTTGGRFSGNVSGQYFTGTWLQTTATSDLGRSPDRYPVLDGAGWLYNRTAAETKSDLGITALETVNDEIEARLSELEYTELGLLASAENVPIQAGNYSWALDTVSPSADLPDNGSGADGVFVLTNISYLDNFYCYVRKDICYLTAMGYNDAYEARLNFYISRNNNTTWKELDITNTIGMEKVIGLEDALFNKSNISHGHLISNIQNLQTHLDSFDERINLLEYEDLGATTVNAIPFAEGCYKWADADGIMPTAGAPTGAGSNYKVFTKIVYIPDNDSYCREDTVFNPVMKTVGKRYLSSSGGSAWEPLDISNTTEIEKVIGLMEALSDKADTSHSHSNYETTTNAASKLAEAKAYTDTELANLINGAPTTLDTLGEIATAMEENADVVQALNDAIGTKANASDLTSHTGNGDIHVTSAKKTNWDSAYTHSQKEGSGVVKDTNPHGLTPVNIGAAAIYHEHKITDVKSLQYALDEKVPKTATINGQTLGSSVELYAEHIMFSNSDTDAPAALSVDNSLLNEAYNVKQAIQVLDGNIKQLDSDFSTHNHNSEYDTKGSAATALTNAKAYADTKVAKTTTIAGHALSSNVTLDAKDIAFTYSGGSIVLPTSEDGIMPLGIYGSNAEEAIVYAVNCGSMIEGRLVSHAGNSDVHITAAQKNNWDYAYNNAEKNQYAFSYVRVGDSIMESNSAKDMLRFDGSNVILTPDTINKKITIGITKENVTTALGYTPPTSNTWRGVQDNLTSIATDQSLSANQGKVLKDLIDTKSNSGHSHSTATTSASGFMSSSDKSKLDGITDGADAVSFTRSLTSGTKVGTITINGTGTDLYAPTNTDTHHQSKNVVGSSTATSNTTTALTNGNVYLNSVENGSVRSTHKISGSGATTVTSDTSGNIVISSTNTTYGSAGSSLGLVKSGGDVTIASGVITVNDDSHNHTIANVDNLQSTLDGKASSTHTHNYAGSSSAGGSATSAVKLDTSAGSATQPVYFSGGKPVATTYTLGKSVPSDAKFTDTTYTSLKNPYALTINYVNQDGDASWSETYDGSSAMTLDVDFSNCAVKNHTHTVADLTGLTATLAELNYMDGVTSNVQTQLNGKAASSHTHSYLPLSGGTLTGTLTSSSTITASGAITSSTYFKVGNSTYGSSYVELYGATPYIDFHYGNSTADFTSRIIESSSGVLQFYGNLLAGTGYGLYFGSSVNNFTTAYDYNGIDCGTDAFKILNKTSSEGIVIASNFRPINDNKISCGTSGYKWTQLFAKTSTISTSDRTVKKDFRTFDSNENYEKFFMDLKPTIYKLVDGTSNRDHFGYISQDVEESLYKFGFDDKSFAGFCRDLRMKNIGEDGEENFVPDLDENGNEQYDYALRYSEFISLNTYMIQKVVSENVILKAKNEELESRLLAVETALAKIA